MGDEKEGREGKESGRREVRKEEKKVMIEEVG